MQTAEWLKTISQAPAGMIWILIYEVELWYCALTAEREGQEIFLGLLYH